jgi:hypothetical protein
VCGLSLPIAAADEGDRVLGDHTFMPTNVVPWGFVGTRAGLAWGGGYAWLDVSDPSSSSSREGQFATLALVAEGRFKVTPWLGIWVDAVGGLVGGTNAAGALDLGMHTGLGGVLGATARLYISGPLQLSAALQVAGLWTHAITPITLELGISIGPPITFSVSNLLSDGHYFDADGSVILEYAFSHLFALQAAVTGGVADADLSGGQTTYVVAGGAALDIGDARSCPIGLTIGLRVVHDFRDESPILAGGLVGTPDTQGFAEVGVHYIGKKDVDLAFHAGVGVGPDSFVGLTGNLAISVFW